jgi:hypothetical protein
MLRVVHLCVESCEKHRVRTQSTEGMCHFGRESEAVQGALSDLDNPNAVWRLYSGPAQGPGTNMTSVPRSW